MYCHPSVQKTPSLHISLKPEAYGRFRDEREVLKVCIDHNIIDCLPLSTSVVLNSSFESEPARVSCQGLFSHRIDDHILKHRRILFFQRSPNGLFAFPLRMVELHKKAE